MGSEIVQKLFMEHKTNIEPSTDAKLDLTYRLVVRDFMHTEQPDVVTLATAKTGDINANNTNPAQFICENLIIGCNAIHQAFDGGFTKFLQVKAYCIYPKSVPQLTLENALLTGTLEPTYEHCAVTKILGIKLCESFNRQHDVDYRSVKPTNFYGLKQNLHTDYSHVMPALTYQFHKVANDCLKRSPPARTRAEGYLPVVSRQWANFAQFRKVTL